jgi:hypothetical protein
MTEAIAAVQHNDSGMLSVSEIRNRVNVVQRVMGEVMKKGTHFGTVPGCGSRMVLLKPGADILASTFRLVPRFDVQRIEIGAGHVEYSVTCTMYAQDGTVLGSGVGSCSTMEKKYRYRKDDNGNKIENEDIADVYNTVLKMAKKRAHIDATITVTGCSDMFTQDIVEEADEKRPVTMPKAKAAQPKTTDAQSVVEGVINDVDVREGEKNGKPWKKYGVHIEGSILGTFDHDHGNLALDAYGNGDTVRCGYVEAGKYKNLTSIEIVPPSDELPM